MLSCDFTTGCILTADFAYIDVLSCDFAIGCFTQAILLSIAFSGAILEILWATASSKATLLQLLFLKQFYGEMRFHKRFSS